MERNPLQRQVAYMRRSLFDQGYLDEQFVQLEDLQDDANPNFVEEIVTLFYTDSARLIHNIEQALESRPLDFIRLDDYMHQFKGSSSRCVRTFQQVKQEHTILRRKLETYFQLARQAGLAN
ncbi:pseudo histidine-containing phosphotransfer protein 5-like isoform X2 [Vitis riparia]|uniref:pseudo histidine-containing phosphotransfer protein 5-like isoform X2 n=1 Tax=Vitis riparia TaxID=96939 RepID=UPI00155AC18D|nr:pseudo histidine-containing phosphotransfer protein 5-like isoform X2 [Vitis riparia]